MCASIASLSRCCVCSEARARVFRDEVMGNDRRVEYLALVSQQLRGRGRKEDGVRSAAARAGAGNVDRYIGTARFWLLWLRGEEVGRSATAAARHVKEAAISESERSDYGYFGGSTRRAKTPGPSGDGILRRASRQQHHHDPLEQDLVVVSGDGTRGNEARVREAGGGGDQGEA